MSSWKLIKKRWRSALFLVIVMLLMLWAAMTLAGCTEVVMQVNTGTDATNMAGKEEGSGDSLTPGAVSFKPAVSSSRMYPVETFDREEN